MMHSRNSRDTSQTLAGIFLLLLCCCLPGSVCQAQPERSFPLQAKRILFLGDSITHSGGYIAWIETQLRLQNCEPLPEFINVGLSSETCSGLSEPEHPFPRPNVQDRLEKALELTQPDVVVACYGMNDGIYHPFSQERFAAYQRGIERLIEKSRAAGAKIVLLTPPPFDPTGPREKEKLIAAGADKYAYFAMYENYDDVLKKYGLWIMQNKQADMVINIHRPLSEFASKAREKDPQFTFTPDGIHPNAQGHRLLGETILTAWGVESQPEPNPELLKLVSQKTALLHDAWLSAIGHSRPGVKAGLPLAEAQQKATELNKQIESLVAAERQPRTSQRQDHSGTYYQVHYPASLEPGRLILSVDYYLWIPADVTDVRGVIVHQHGCGLGACMGGRTAAEDLHWQALARKWNCALLGSSYEPREGYNCRLWCDPRNGSATQFLTALEHFAEETHQPELTTAPWCLWGHSGGAFWASLMQTMHPERIVAIWLQSGTAYSAWIKGDIPEPEITPAALGVPVLGCPGGKEKDHPRFQTAWNGTHGMQARYRELGAPFFEFAPDPLTGHETGDSRYLAIPFFDFWLKQRLPTGDNNAQQLRPVSQASLSAWVSEMGPKQQEFMKTGAVSDTTPPPAPSAVKAERGNDGTVRLTWQVEADFESGLQGFVITRNGEKVATLPEKPSKRFGRPLFQAMSYHDTPEAPVPALEWIDPSAPAGAIPRYQVQAINSVGLTSPPASNE